VTARIGRADVARVGADLRVRPVHPTADAVRTTRERAAPPNEPLAPPRASPIRAIRSFFHSLARVSAKMAPSFRENGPNGRVAARLLLLE